MTPRGLWSSGGWPGQEPDPLWRTAQSTVGAAIGTKIMAKYFVCSCCSVIYLTHYQKQCPIQDDIGKSFGLCMAGLAS